MISKGMAAWFERHPTVRRRQLAAKAGRAGIDPALVSKYLNAERWDGSTPWDAKNMVMPRETNALRLEQAMKRIDADDFVPASYWGDLRLERAKVQGRRGRRRKSDVAPKAKRVRKPAAPRAAALPAA